ncbi:hypothetical protein G6F57_011294 [Rhizopus arrhizus]|nr:hypothetical protein G6F35_016395 [Rhizopus arrhizus]KAG1471696.1 hypothetical protein G6F57_011294 [Rhizopus arrhizus]
MVQRAGRLIGQHDGAAIHQRTRDGHALLLAAGQLAWPVRGALAQAQCFQQRACTGSARICIHAGIHRRQRHVLAAPAHPAPSARWPRRSPGSCPRSAGRGSRECSSASIFPIPTGR